MGRNETITASTLVVFCRPRVITRTTLLEVRTRAHACALLSMHDASNTTKTS
jgi:hypothetical protein